jgi:hypothetical protein
MVNSIPQFLRSNPAVGIAWGLLGLAYGGSCLYSFAARYINANANENDYPNIKKRQFRNIDDVIVFEITPLAYEQNDNEGRIIFLSSSGFSTIWPKDLMQSYVSTAYKTKMKTLVVNCQINPQHSEDSRVTKCFALYSSLLRSFSSENLFFYFDNGSEKVCNKFYSLCRKRNIPLPQIESSTNDFFAAHRGQHSRL